MQEHLTDEDPDHPFFGVKHRTTLSLSLSADEDTFHLHQTAFLAAVGMVSRPRPQILPSVG